MKGTNDALRVGFVGSGFIAGFHLESLVSVRRVEVVGVYSPTKSKREAFASRVQDLDLGPCVATDSLEELCEIEGIDAIWVLSPNDTRREVISIIANMVIAGETSVRAIACEKPLARTLGEATDILNLVRKANLNHGYLENQVFAPSVSKGKEIIWGRAVPSSGRPYLARAAEEHSGPHEPWFWTGERQGGGVLSDMMCHSVEVGRHLLTRPGARRDSLTLISANASVANLKWTQDKYAKQLNDKMGLSFDFRDKPVEDFARGVLEFEDEDGKRLLVEASTSWSYVGAGLRIEIEMQGPEYAMEFDSLDSRLQVFMSRHIAGDEGEDLVEKQNAEQGLMPIAEDEPTLYGYVGENRHMVERFRANLPPDETFEDGVEVVRILMAMYKSAEEHRTVFVDQEDLENFVPRVARLSSGGETELQVNTKVAGN